ncbi:response regulator [Rhodobacteraceae bacterium D3-12]|nr:response regulator [Rhodobacteraceae bacterium D3-12]
MPDTNNTTSNAETVRSALRAAARIIATDRRPTILATETAEILLANAPANRLGLDGDAMVGTLNWPTLCKKAKRAGSIAVSFSHNGANYEGEVVHFPMEQANGYLLRLAESDQEATVLRNRARTATLMRVAHDLRTPIQSLLATIDDVFEQQPADSAQAMQSREMMRGAAGHTLDHIDNVLKVLRGELTASGLQEDEAFDLSAELASVVQMIDPIAKSRGASVTLTQTPEGEIWTTGPVRFVRALMQNMVDNSVKYGGNRIDVCLTCTRKNASVENGEAPQEVLVFIEVADFGGGIPADQKARLQRALGHTEIISEASATQEQGENQRPSAGMNVLAHALRQLGGQMEILDRNADGLPVAKTEEHIAGSILRVRFALAGATPDKPSDTPPGAAQHSSPLSGVGILVVEDSPASRSWITQVLQSTGAKVQAVENGLEALDVLKQPDAEHGIQLLLSDMTLPHISGVELLRRIAKAQKIGEMAWRGHLLGITAHIDETLRETCRQLGMEKMLTKPIRSAQLRSEVLNAVKTRSSMTRPKKQLATATPRTPPSIPALCKEVAGELTSELGRDQACGFMKRALSEAHSAWQDINETGVREEETARALHAATGACGLTGLKLVEHCLRAIELCIETPGADLASPMADLKNALERTSDEIALMS